MPIFDLGIKILLSLTSFFFFVFFYLTSLWSKPAHPESRYGIALMLSAIYSFVFLLGGFVIFGILFFLWENWPTLFNLIKTILS